MLPELIFVDLKTTGIRPTTDKIIEIAFYVIKYGINEYMWHQTIDPGTLIPYQIQLLTSITPEIIAHSPSFKKVAAHLNKWLHGKILVGQNARLIYAFLKNEMKTCGISFQAKTICVARLSQLLFPDEKKHNLTALNQRFDLEISTHSKNAMTEVQCLALFFKKLATLFSHEHLQSAFKYLLKTASLPFAISQETIKNIPNGAGVYRFYGDNQILLYVGKSIHLRDRIKTHFSSDHASNKEMRLSQQVKFIDWISTAGELGALLLESKLIKKDLPIFNQRSRRHKDLFTIQLIAASSKYHYLKVINLTHILSLELASTYGLFRSKRQAEQSLQNLLKNHQLCGKFTSLYNYTGVCFDYQLKKCKGACANKESLGKYNQRVKKILKKISNKNWPYPGKIAIKECCPETNNYEFHVVDQWCYLATVKKEQDLYEMDWEKMEAHLDLDVYKIMLNFLDLSFQEKILSL